MLLDLGFNVLL